MKTIKVMLIATTAVLMSATALAVPPSSDLLDCNNVPPSTADGDCNAELRYLCDATAFPEVGPLDGGFGFKKTNDQDSLVSKVVGAAIKFDQGGSTRRVDQANTKLEDYGSKVNGWNCFSTDPDLDESKPKIECGLQEDLISALIDAQGVCPSS